MTQNRSRSTQSEIRAQSAARHRSREAEADAVVNLNVGPKVSPAMTLWLVIVWTVMFQQISWLVVLSGILFAVAIQLVFPMPSHLHLWHVRIGYAIVLVARFVWDLVIAGIQVSKLVLTGNTHPDGIVECRTRSGNPVYLTVVAAMCSMIPGTVVVKVDPAKKLMYLHALNLPAQGGAEGVRSSVANQEKRVLLAMATNAAVTAAGYGKYLPLSRRAREDVSGRVVHQRREED